MKKMNLGIDFGSTYSMLSYYNQVDDTVQAIQSQMGSKYIPSIACYDYSNELLSGDAAKTFLASSPGWPSYRAFKMLLPECDPKRLERRGYSSECSPRHITREFLRQQLLMAMESCDVDRFENVIICIPAVWNKELYTMSGKAILRDICRELGMMDKVTVVSEPAAATACFVYNYRKNTRKFYDGLILIVDYGGGTLDITLTRVNTTRRTDGTQAMEIDVLGQTGAGENHGENIGDAGIAYMEGVVKLALQNAGISDSACDGFFLQTLNILEAALISNSGALEKRLRQKYVGVPEHMEDDDSVFTKIPYKGKPYPVTYADLYNTYQSVIQPVLAQQLQSISQDYLQPEGIDPRQTVNGFKIALVGGFGQFFLVQKQVMDYFHISDTLEDLRLKDIQGAGGGKQDAISFGAALIADNVVSMRKSAKLSIGLFTTRDGHDTFNYAIQYRNDLEYGRIYHVGRPIFYGGPGTSSANKSPWVFAIGQGKNLNKAYRMVPLPEKQAELEQIPANKAYHFGFSVDDSDVYTFHVIPLDMDTNREITDKATKLELGNFSDIFGPNVVYDERNAFYKKQ